MGKKVDPRDFLLNTDFEMDKLILVKEGKLNGAQTAYIPHGLPFQPLAFGLCSFNADFSVPKPSPYNQDPEFIGSPDPFIRYKISFAIATVGDNIRLTYTNQNNSSTPIYYRIYAFEPTTVNKKIGPTKDKAKVFSIDTDRDYRKLYKKGIVNIGSSLTITHNFGYIPQMMIWYDMPALDVGYITNSYTLTDSNVIYTDKNKVVITYPSSSGEIYVGAKIHYRIYYDET